MGKEKDSVSHCENNCCQGALSKALNPQLLSSQQEDDYGDGECPLEVKRDVAKSILAQ